MQVSLCNRQSLCVWHRKPGPCRGLSNNLSDSKNWDQSVTMAGPVHHKFLWKSFLLLIVRGVLYSISLVGKRRKEGKEQRRAFLFLLLWVGAMAPFSTIIFVRAAPSLKDRLVPKHTCLSICFFKCFYYIYLWGGSDAQRTTCWMWLSSPTLWVLGLELRSLNLDASTFPSWIISPSSILLPHISLPFTSAWGTCLPIVCPRPPCWCPEH